LPVLSWLLPNCKRTTHGMKLWLTHASALWVLTAIFVFLHWRKHRFAEPLASRQTIPAQVTATLYHGGIPFNNIGDEGYTQIFHVPAPPDYWGHPSTPLSAERGPIIPDIATSDEDASVNNAGEASMRQSEESAAYPSSSLTVSTGPSVGRDVANLKGIVASQSVSPSVPSSRAAGASTGPPSNTEQIDWSARSSLQNGETESATGSVSDGRMRWLTMGDVTVEF
jgi:hypothetical protein